MEILLCSLKQLTEILAGANVRTLVKTSLRQPPGQNLRQVIQRWQSTASAEIANSSQVRQTDRQRCKTND